MSDRQEGLGIVSSGRRNLERASRDRIRTELLVRHETQLQEAGLIRRLVIAWRIRREARRVLKDEAPPSALYMHRRYAL